MSTLRRTAATLALILATSPAHAHEYWLSPSSYRLKAGDHLSIGAEVGTGFRGESKPFAATRVRTLVAQGAKRIDLSKVGANGDFTWARWIAGDGGGQLVGYHSDFAKIDLPASEFDHYLEVEGLDTPRAARAKLGAKAGPGRERYARCPKTWIAGDQPQRAIAVLGLPIEIAPLADPGKAGPLAVKVLWKNRPLANALVGAWRAPLAANFAPLRGAERDSLPPVTRVRTGRDGVAKLAIEGEGEWLVAAVHMVPSTDRKAADWESWWASYTFARTRP